MKKNTLFAVVFLMFFATCWCEKINKRMKHFFLILMTICVFAGGCTETTEGYEPSVRKNMIDSYINADSIAICQSEAQNSPKLMPYAYAYFIGGDITEQNSPDEFAELAKHINDTIWNGHAIMPRQYQVVNDSIFFIEIITESDYDDAHKTGENVADIVKFYSSSPYNYIQNGYKATQNDIQTQEMKENDIILGQYELITCYCSEIQNVQTKYFEPSFDLLFTQKPAKNGTYVFELKLKLSQKTLTAKFTMEF
jgi:hypothetical protein